MKKGIKEKETRGKGEERGEGKREICKKIKKGKERGEDNKKEKLIPRRVRNNNV